MTDFARTRLEERTKTIARKIGRKRERERERARRKGIERIEGGER